MPGRQRDQPITTYLLLSLNIFTYLYLAFESHDPFVLNQELMDKFGFRKEAFLTGAYWQLFTNMFAHFDLPHLGYNMIFLAFFGSRAEELFGSIQTLFFYILFGLTTTFIAFIYPLGTVSAGASGAIFGLLGADLIAQRGIYANRVWTSLLIGLAFFVLAAATGFLAHLVGLITGFIAGYIATWNWYPGEEDPDKSLDEVALD